MAVAVVDSLDPTDTARPSVLLLRCYFVLAVTVRLYASNAENAERIRTLILSGDGALSTGRNAIWIVWNREKVTGRVQKTLRRVVVCSAVDATDSCIGKDQTKWREV